MGLTVVGGLATLTNHVHKMRMMFVTLFKKDKGTSRSYSGLYLHENP